MFFLTLSIYLYWHFCLYFFRYTPNITRKGKEHLIDTFVMAAESVQ